MRYATIGLLTFATVCLGQQEERVGIEEHLGKIVPLDSLTFNDEQGKPVTLSELADRPIVLTLVYYRCPGICTPLLQELVRVADGANAKPGEDYRMITVSFDPEEDAKLARNKKTNMLNEFKKKTVPPEAWRFFTGTEENIRKITESVGFYYVRDRNKVDFVHGSTIIFLSKDGKIVRYLNGLKFNPAEMDMAVLDAAEGRPRSLMQKMQQLCYSYDPSEQAYRVRLDRIILGATLLFIVGFVVFLLRKGGKRTVPPDEPAVENNA